MKELLNKIWASKFKYAIIAAGFAVLLVFAWAGVNIAATELQDRLNG